MRLVLSVSLPLLLVEAAIFAAWYYSRWDLERVATLAAARGIAGDFEDFVQDVRRQELAVGVALTGLSPYTPAQAARFLAANVREYPAVRTWSWHAPDGKVMASSDRRTAALNVATEPLFRELRQGREWAIGDLLTGLPGETAGFLIARRIDDARGRLLGIVSALVEPCEFGAHLRALHHEGVGEAAVFDHRGVCVYANDPRRQGHESCRKTDPLLDATLATGSEQPGVLRVFNETFIAARVPIAETGWAAGSRRSAREAMADVYAGLWLAGGASLLVAVGSALSAAALSRGLIRQLRRLQSHADAIARGETTHAADGADVRELADLAATFNRMGDAVRDAQRELQIANAALEERVRRRTDQLASTIRRLETEVSQRLRTEQELRSASLYARGLLEASLDPLVTISPEGQVTDVNEATVHAIGATRGELLGSDFSDYFTEPERARAGYRKVLSEGLVRDYALTIRRVDGHTIDVLYNAVVYRNEAGQVQGVCAVARDVTEQNRIAAELDRHRRHLEGLVEQSTAKLRYQLQLVQSIANEAAESIVVTDRQGRVTFLNAEAERTFQWNAQEAIGQVFHDLTHHHHPDGSDYPAADCPLHGVYAVGETVRDHEDVFFRKDGSPMAVECSSAPLDVGGQRIGGVLIVRDITERKRAAEAVEELASYPRLNPSPIAEVALDGTVLFVNPAAQRLFPGLQTRALAHPWLADWGQVASLLSEGQTPLHVREAKIDNRYFLQTLHYLKKRRRVRIYGTEITDRKQAEESLKTTADQLAHSNEELEQFAYIASHDLQEPLRVINGYVELLSQKYRNRLDGDAEQFLQYIVDGASRMRQLITDLLEYSRVGNRPGALEPVDLRQVVEQVRADLGSRIAETGAALECGPLPTVRGDAVQLVRLFVNLIGNAIKFHGASPPRIEVSACPEGDDWHLQFHDNGIGIERQYWDRIFVIFQRLHTRQKYPGTGIGLAICKRIVERHGGAIWVDSVPGEGTTFHVTLPQLKPTVTTSNVDDH